MLLVGGAVTGLWLARELVQARHRVLVSVCLAVGAGVVIAGAYVEVVLTLRDVLGRADTELVLRYLRATRHGHVVQQRAVLAPLLAVFTAARLWLRPQPIPAGHALGIALPLAVAVTAGWLLSGFSDLSHAAAMGGGLPFAADLVHLTAAAVWAGPLFYLALMAWEDERTAAAAAFARLSRVGIGAVVVLALTGSFNALTHIQEPAEFVSSAYGWSLWVKLALVAAVVITAAVNHFRHLPSFLAGGSGERLRRSVRLEAAFLVMVFLATGALTTAALPHGDAEPNSAFLNLARLWQFLVR